MTTLKKLKKLRIQQKMSQRVLGEVVGCGKQHISNIENGKSKPSFDLIEKITHALGYRFGLLLEDGNFTETLKGKKDETKTD